MKDQSNLSLPMVCKQNKNTAHPKYKMKYIIGQILKIIRLNLSYQNGNVTFKQNIAFYSPGT